MQLLVNYFYYKVCIYYIQQPMFMRLRQEHVEQSAQIRRHPGVATVGRPHPQRNVVSQVVHSDEQKSIGLKFSKSRTGSHVTYSCHNNSSRFTCPIKFPRYEASQLPAFSEGWVDQTLPTLLSVGAVQWCTDARLYCSHPSLLVVEFSVVNLNVNFYSQKADLG